MMAIWLSGNALVSINLELYSTLGRARRRPGWVTVSKQVNHLGAEPATQVNSSWSLRG